MHRIAQEYPIYSGVKANVKINFAWLKSLVEPSLRKPQSLYARVPLIFRAMNIRADNLVRVPFYFSRAGRETEEYPFEESLPFRDLLRQTEMALMAAGKSTVLILESDYKGLKTLGAGLQWLNPFTVEVKAADNDDGTYSLRFRQFEKGRWYPRNKPYWSEEEMYYIHEFDFETDYEGGVAPANVVLNDANVNYTLTSFLAKFFENGAVPPIIVSSKEEVGSETKKEIASWFKEKLKGFLERVLVLGGGNVEVKQLISELHTFDIDKVDEHIIRDVAHAFGMSPTTLAAGSANRATAEFEDLHLMRTVEARAKFHEDKLNRFLKPFGYSVKSNIQELPEFQEDEEQRSGALYNLSQAGVPLYRGFQILGYNLEDEYWDELKAEYARKLKQKEEAQNQPPPQPVPQLPGNGQLKMELRKWMRKAIQRFNEGKSPAVRFSSEHIPEEEQKRITLALSNVTSTEEIKFIFNDKESEGV